MVGCLDHAARLVTKLLRYGRRYQMEVSMHTDPSIGFSMTEKINSAPRPDHKRDRSETAQRTESVQSGNQLQRAASLRLSRTH